MSAKRPLTDSIEPGDPVATFEVALHLLSQLFVFWRLGLVSAVLGALPVAAQCDLRQLDPLAG